MITSWHTYPSIYALGHRYITDLLLDSVTVEEKLDGSQFSFGVFLDNDGHEFVRCRSKGAEINVLAPEKMFNKAVTWVIENQAKLTLGWTYRAEYLAKPKHNALVYDRVPRNHLILFDINPTEEQYLSYRGKEIEADRIGLEVVPLIHIGMITDIQQFREYLDRVSCLGGQKIEGVVIKNYARFGLDKKVLMGKFVSETFKEVHAANWKEMNPGQGDIVAHLIASYKSPARWAKALQHLAECGKLEQSPRDIALLIKEIPADIEKECAAEIREALWKWAWPKIRRGVMGGMPEWYKEQLLLKQFEGDHDELPK